MKVLKLEDGREIMLDDEDYLKVFDRTWREVPFQGIMSYTRKPTLSLSAFLFGSKKCYEKIYLDGNEDNWTRQNVIFRPFFRKKRQLERTESALTEEDHEC